MSFTSHPGPHIGDLTSPKAHELDAHQDTPVEILHTILLGFVKYMWKHIVTAIVERGHGEIGAVDKAQLIARLNALSIDGLSIPRLRRAKLVAHATSLIGRDLKALAQLAIFAIEPYATPTELAMWATMMQMMSLVWFPVIPDMADYIVSSDSRFTWGAEPLPQAQLNLSIEAFLAAAALENLDWFNKPKFHILTHLGEAIKRFGPALHFSTQRQESYNGVFRDHSTHSSKRDPGREITLAFSHHNRFRHAISGGFYKPSVSSEWRQAGSKARALFEQNSDLRGHLGLHTHIPAEAGEPKKTSRSLRFCLIMSHERSPRLPKRAQVTRRHRPWPASCSVHRLCRDSRGLLPRVLYPVPIRGGLSIQKDVLCSSPSPQDSATLQVARITRLGAHLVTKAVILRVELFRTIDACEPLMMPRIRSTGKSIDLDPSVCLLCLATSHC